MLGSVLIIHAAILVNLTVPGTFQAQEKPPQQAPENGTRQIRVTVLGLSCPFCAYGVEQKLKRLQGVQQLEIELETGVALLIMADGHDLSNDTLQKVVENAGFEVARIIRNFESEYLDLKPGRSQPPDSSGVAMPAEQNQTAS